MALQGFWGFDDTVAEPGANVGGAAGNVGRTGTGLVTAAIIVALTVPTPATTLIMGGAFKPSSWGATNPLINFLEGGTTHVTITLDASLHVVATRNGTVLATSTNAFPATANVWHYIEVKVVIHDTAGSVIVKVDGTEWLNVSGVDTRNAGTTGAISEIDLYRVNANQTFWDDAYVADTTGPAPYNDFLGDVKVHTELPSGNGDSSDWIGSDGNSVDNYQLVDEASSSSTDYVASATVGAQDLYQMGTAPAGVTVLAVQEWVYAAKSDAGTPPNLAIVEKNGATTRVDANLPALSTSYQPLAGTVRTTAPDGSALDVTKVNNTQVGVKVTS